MSERKISLALDFDRDQYTVTLYADGSYSYTPGMVPEGRHTWTPQKRGLWLGDPIAAAWVPLMDAAFAVLVEQDPLPTT